MGNYKVGSDVDLAIDGEISQSEVFTISGILNDEIASPYMYDVLILHMITNVALLAHINTHGVMIYERKME